MGCGSCGTSNGGSPSGCGDKGHCGNGGCNRKNTYDWLSDKEIYDPSAYAFVEVSFKQGARKEFYACSASRNVITGDKVVVETNGGYDVGLITLSGELVRLQMRKKSTSEDKVIYKVIRKANDRDLEKLQEARDLERGILVQARVISRTMGLDMKIGDIEYQGDKRKATFYYTADGRIDFRELVRSYAKEFRIKIEMRQIGARQESARIGGIGSCGRELCCSTWLSDFKSVTTSAARYQNIAINQTKLSGQCGRLKCCLNYELDTYMDALSHFPKKADVLLTEAGRANLIKTDIFKGIMFYAVEVDRRRGPVIALDKEKVKEILEMNKKGEKPRDLASSAIVVEPLAEPELEFADVTGEIELPSIKKPKRNNKNRRNNKPRTNSGRDNKDQNSPQANRGTQKQGEGEAGNKPVGKKPQRRRPNPRNKPNNKAKGTNTSGGNEPNSPKPTSGPANNKPSGPAPVKDNSNAPSGDKPKRTNNKRRNNRNRGPKKED